MPKFAIELDDGRQFEVEADTQPTPEEVVSFINTSQQEKPKPLSFIERGKFAFGDEPGRRQFLEERFPGKEIGQLPSGKFTVSGTPVDPEGFDLGDLSDVSDEIVRLGGQIAGATTGFLGTGGFGTVAGGAAGRGAGQVGVEAIGRALGVRENEVPEIAKDILRETALGAAGEAGGMALAKVSSPGIKFLQNFFNKNKQKFLDPAIRSFFKFTGDVEDFALRRVQEKGASQVITKENLSDAALLRVANKIQDGVKDLRGKLGRAVGEQKKLLKNSNKSIKITKPKEQFRKELVDADIIDFLGNEKGKLIAAKEAPRNELLKIKDTLDSFDKNMSAKQAIQLKGELGELIEKSFAPEGKIRISTNEQRIIKQLSNNLDTQLGRISDDFRIANEQFSEMAGLQDALKTNLDLPRGEIFVKDVLKEKFPEFPKQKLIELNNILPKGKQFFEELSDVAAAQQFKSSTFRGIRSGIFSSIAGGAGFGFGGPLAGAAGLATGAAVSTPRLVGKLLGGQQAIGKGIAGGVGALGRTAAREAVPAFGKFRGQ